MQSIDELADVITDLDASEQQALLNKVAQMNFQKGLHDLAAKYRARLAAQKSIELPSRTSMDRA